MPFFDCVTLLLMLFSIILYLFSVFYYRSFFNPLGIYSIIWGTIPFLYQLKLFSILQDLSIETEIALFISYFSFGFTCMFFTHRQVYRKVKMEQVTERLTQRAKRIYWVLLMVCIVEMLIKTPPLFSANPFMTYMEGVGVRFLHFAVTLIVVPTLILTISPYVKRKRKILYVLPCIIIPLIYMQRGLSVFAIIAIIFVVQYSISLKKQLLYVTLSAFLLVNLITLVGSFRQSFNTSASSISDVTGASSDVPESIIWLYAYTTPSVQNLNQAINNDKTMFKYGFDVIEPVLSVLQLKFFENNLFSNYKEAYTVIDGFNVPTYLYWAYINFGFMGFVIVPSILAFILQCLYNKFVITGNMSAFIFYAIFLPNLVYSFHDFLFWNAAMFLNIILVVIMFHKIKISSKIKI